MADTLTSITTFVNSPPGHVVAGGVLAGIVWKFFERVENLLTEETKFEVAVWLVGLKTADKVLWPETFVKVFDRVFGKDHFSWYCFRRSCMATVVTCLLCAIPGVNSFFAEWPPLSVIIRHGVTAALFLLPIDYLSLLHTRWALGKAIRMRSTIAIAALLLANIFTTGALGSIATFAQKGSTLVDLYIQRSNVAQQLASLEEFRNKIYEAKTKPLPEVVIQTCGDVQHAPALSTECDNLFKSQQRFSSEMIEIEVQLNKVTSGWRKLDADFSALWIFILKTLTVTWVPAFFASIWLWLYAGSGFLLKAARRFDLGFQWFNRKFDIEKHPLSSIGLVAGALVACVYWAAVIVSRLV